MTNKPLPRRLPAFAIDLLTQHPIALTLPAAGFGMLCRLIFHFISTQCRPIPTGGDDLCGIMRAHRPTWNTHKKDILAIFRELEPQLIESQRQYMQRRAAVAAMGEKGRVAQRLRALHDRKPRSKSPDQLAPTAPKRAQITTAPPTFPPTDGEWR
jgi:hypothetical protein